MSQTRDCSVHREGFASTFVSANAFAESGGEIFGKTSGSVDASGCLYGAGKFGYSAKSVSKTGLAIAVSAGANNYVTSSVSHADVDF